jgi:hypothetical protein
MEYRRKVDRLSYCIFNDGRGGLVHEMEAIKDWQKEIESLVNQIKGLKILVFAASFISAVQIILKVWKP